MVSRRASESKYAGLMHRCQLLVRYGLYWASLLVVQLLAAHYDGNLGANGGGPAGIGGFRKLDTVN